MSDPCMDDHEIMIDEFLRIPLFLYVMFSYFEVRTPTVDELEETESVLLLTLEHFDAHDTRYAQQEKYMID